MGSGINGEEAAIQALKEQVVQDLNRMMHDLAGVARQFRAHEQALPPGSNVVRLHRPETSYVMQYRDAEGCSRFAVVRAVEGHTAERLTVMTSQGRLTVDKAGIQDWVPVAEQEDEPFPAGWWNARPDGEAH